MIVDCHVHLALSKDDYKSSENQVENLLDCMERVGIDKACLIPMVYSSSSQGFYPGREHIIFAAEFLTKIITDYQGRFFSMLWINPNLDVKFIKDLIGKYILSGKINGIKLWTEMNANDERLEPLADYLEQHDIPVLIHSWYNSLGRTFCESHPSDIAGLARKHPGLRIVMAHLTGCQYRGIQEIKKLRNVSIDTSGAGAEDGYLEYALRELGPERILYGSDYPGRDLAVQMARIDSVAAEPYVKRKLFCENAEKFFRS